MSCLWHPCRACSCSDSWTHSGSSCSSGAFLSTLSISVCVCVCSYYVCVLKDMYNFIYKLSVLLNLSRFEGRDNKKAVVMVTRK